MRMQAIKLTPLQCFSIDENQILLFPHMWRMRTDGPQKTSTNTHNLDVNPVLNSSAKQVGLKTSLFKYVTCIFHFAFTSYGTMVEIAFILFLFCQRTTHNTIVPCTLRFFLFTVHFSFSFIWLDGECRHAMLLQTEL